MTKEEIRELLGQIQELPYFDDVMADKLDDVICGELEVNSKKLVQAILDDDIDAVIAAFTGWDAEGLLFGEFSPLHRFVQTPRPAVIGAPVHTPPTDGHWHEEDYTWEVCPECDTEQVIYSKGITACPNCGAPIAPCSCCEECISPCPYGCTGSDDHLKAVTNPPVSKPERDWFIMQTSTPPASPPSVPAGNNAESVSPFATVPEEPIYECPWYGIDFGFNCPFSGHGICSEPCGPCSGPADVGTDANDEEDEDEPDGDEFECCYDCSQCEINGSCERQEHLNEVDSEVDAL